MSLLEISQKVKDASTRRGYTGIRTGLLVNLDSVGYVVNYENECVVPLWLAGKSSATAACQEQKSDSLREMVSQAARATM